MNDCHQEISNEDKKVIYKTVQNGGDIPFGGLRNSNTNSTGL